MSPAWFSTATFTPASTARPRQAFSTATVSAILASMPPGVSLYQLLNQSPAAPMQPQQEQQMAV
jgi:hypothetical protein